MTPERARQLLEVARDADLLGPETTAWVDRLEPEREEIAEAVAFFAEEGRVPEALEVAASLWRLWSFAGDLAGGRELLARALGGGGSAPSRLRALALYGDGVLAFRQGAQADSRARNEDALEVARAVRDPETEALALVGLSRVALRDGEYGRVRSLASEARALTDGLDPAAEAMPLHMLAAGTRLEGDLDAAAALYEESLELNRRLGDDRMAGVELHNIGHVEVHRGNIDAARRCFDDALALRTRGDPYDDAMTLLNRAALASARGADDDARAALRSCESTLADAGISLDPDDRFEVDWLRARLG